jgi:hypothetical protein
MNKIVSLIILLFISSSFFAQNGTLTGTVKDKNTQELIFGAKVIIENLNKGAITDENGNYKIILETGTYNVKVVATGYVTQNQYNIVLSSGGIQQVNFELVNSVLDVKEVNASYNKEQKVATTDMVTPLSVQQLTTEEIKSNPGGGFDVSKVVQTLPGIGSSGGGAPRNDIIVRGGAPNENVYYLDGIEIPVLNHFQTQGSSGGAQGILNVTFIEDLKLSSSAFDARYDNALASTFVIKQRQGNTEKLSGNLRASFTESALTLEGPLSKSKKNNFLLSSRFSYLDLLFTLIDLPIRPRYSDFQYKVTHKFNNKTSLTALGIGAIDKFSFGATKNSSPENEYFRRSLPFIEQWNYTTGFNVKHLINKGFMNFSLSRNMFNNQIDRFEDAKNDQEEFRNLKLVSQEIENKFRFDYNKYVNGWKYSFGVMGQYVKYNTDFYSKLSNAVLDTNGNVISPKIEISSKSAIEFFKYGAFLQVSKNFFNEKLLISSGLRSDMNNFLEDGNNFLKTLSPRVSASYRLSKRVDVSASFGSYYKIPTYTSLGYRDANNVLVNKNLKYINSKHYVLGGQFLPNESLRITLEGFYKTYSNYPVSVANGISLGNQGSEFGAVGNEAVTSTGDGETYGFEIFVQQKLIKKIFYFASYSFVRSFYSGSDNALIASAWDNQHLLSATLGYKLKKNWQIGVKYRLAGGVPYTPFNLEQSQETYATTGVGFLDYTNLNGNRLQAFNQVDLRIDKIANFDKFTLTFFIDIQNLLLNSQQGTPYYTFKRNADNTAFETTDGQALKVDGSNAIPLVLENNSKNVTPSLGLIFDF